MSKSDYLAIVRPIVEQAGHIALELRAQGLEHSYKEDGTPVTNADIVVSDFLTRELLAAFPDTRVISEESKDVSGVSHPLTWVIDPIDGTKKYHAGRDIWCVMIALFDTRPIFSIIYYPQGPTWYWAERGHGAFIEENGDAKRIHLPLPHDPPRVMHAPECVMRIGERSSHGYMKHVRRILWDRLDVYLRSSVGYWDLVPPMLILEEAGGLVVDKEGKPLRLTEKTAVAHDVICGQPEAVKTVIAAIHEANQSRHL